MDTGAIVGAGQGERGRSRLRPRLLRLAVVIGAWVLGAATTEAAAAPRAGLKLHFVRHAQLLKDLERRHGRRVLLLFWGNYSVPDNHLLREVVKLHEKHGARVAFVSVCIDPPSGDVERLQRRVARTLESARATFPTYLLNERADVWSEHWRIVPPGFVLLDEKGVPVSAFDLTDRPFTIRDVEAALAPRR